MRLTCRSEYALLALVYLARHQDEDYISVQTICAAQQIPCKFLEQILLTLRPRSIRPQFQGQERRVPIGQVPRQDFSCGDTQAF